MKNKSKKLFSLGMAGIMLSILISTCATQNSKISLTCNSTNVNNTLKEQDPPFL